MGAAFPIGTASNQLAPGGTIRFVARRAGEDLTDGSVGGGGTGILYLPPNGDPNNAGNWNLLLVAGGGGATGDCCTNRTTGEPGSVGDPGKGYTNTEVDGGGGGGGLRISYPITGEGADSGYNPLPVGGAGGTQAWGITNVAGGFGFGAGGAGCKVCGGYGGGGGGGYSGGKEGVINSSISGFGSSNGGGGGTSYINTQWAIASSLYKQKFGEAGDAKDGFAFYKASSSPQPSTANYIVLKSHSNKCIDLDDGNTSNGAKIQLWDCYIVNPNQAWVVDRGYIRSTVNPNKCLDLSAGITSNGNKIQLWDCLPGSTNQQWIVEVNTGLIKLKTHPEKCIDLDKGNLDNGNKVQIWDCVNNSTQHWIVSNYTPPNFDENLGSYIVLKSNTARSFRPEGGSTAAGTRIVQTARNEDGISRWRYDHADYSIRLMDDPDKCIELPGENTYNGTPVQLAPCNGSTVQQWILDGNQIRYKADPSKTLSTWNINRDGELLTIWTLLGISEEKRTFLFYPANTMGYYLAMRDNQSMSINRPPNWTGGSGVRLGSLGEADEQTLWTYNPSTLGLHPMGRPDMCLETPQGNTTDGTNLQLQPCNLGHFQQWRINGASFLYQANPAKCMMVWNIGRAGEPGKIWKCAGISTEKHVFDFIPK